MTACIERTEPFVWMKGTDGILRKMRKIQELSAAVDYHQRHADDITSTCCTLTGSPSQNIIYTRLVLALRSEYGNQIYDNN